MENKATAWALTSAFAGTLVWISLSYSGFNAAVYIAGEAKRPKQTVPRSLLAGSTTVLILYVLLNAVFVYAPPSDMIKGVPDVAALAAKSLGGDAFEQFVRWTIAVCLLTSVFSMLMAAPRVYAKMADDGLLPSHLQLKGDSPLAAMILQIMLAVLLVIASDLQGLLTYLGLTLSISAACSVLCLFLPSVRTKPLLHGVHILPAIYIICTMSSAVVMTVNDPWQLVGTLLTFVVGGVAYVFTRQLGGSH